MFSKIFTGSLTFTPSIKIFSQFYENLFKTIFPDSSSPTSSSSLYSQALKNKNKRLNSRNNIPFTKIIEWIKTFFLFSLLLSIFLNSCSKILPYLFYLLRIKFLWFEERFQGREHFANK